MRPIRLEMEGFGAFRAPTVVDFSDIELVVLVGRTGSGKSTVIDALTFALYGSVARYDDNRAVAPVINQTGTRARVRLEFDVGGRRYTAARLVQRQGSGATTKEARLECGGDVLASDARGVTSAVTDLLGLDAGQFNRTIVLPQGRFADFLHDEPGKRQETLRGLLGLGIYREVASAARRRGADRAAQVDALRADVDDATDLTDGRWTALVERRDTLAAGRASVAAALADLDERRRDLGALERELNELDERQGLLAGVSAPDGLDGLERQLDTAAAALASTTAAVGAARDTRRAVDAAAARGPDIARVNADLAVQRDSQRAVAEHAATSSSLAAADVALTGARHTAAEVDGRQHDLDRIAAAARIAEREARGAVDAGPSPAQLDHWITQRRRQRDGGRRAAALEAELDGAAGAEAPLRRAFDRAIETERAARTSRDDLQQRAGAAGFAHLLAIGAPCPLCLQEVHDVPAHHIDDDVSKAVAALDVAMADAAAIREDLDAAERARQAVAARLDADRRALGALDAELAGVADEAALVAQQTDAALLRAQLVAAVEHTRTADDAAGAHRRAADTIAAHDALASAEAAAAGLRSLEETQRVRRDAAVAVAADRPSVEQLEVALAAAAALARQRDDAAVALAAAEDAHERAMADQAAAEDAQRAAVDALHRTRDRLAPLGPPAIGVSWGELLAWVELERDALAARRTEVAERVTATADAVAMVEHDMRVTGHALLGPSDLTPPALRDALLTAEATSVADLATFDRARAHHLAREARIDQLDAERAVADRLGHLLRSDGFEAWLMEAALGELVDDAGERLRELSSGQFSLQLVGRDLMVRDHANADELRGARTLSGGETFLASLSLALALAEATSNLATEGAPALESIFLDEGFGTLDPSTLDVVASAIEELGSAGRMVAVVTHIRELADRMPVRFEVTKVGSSATVERVDA